MRLVTFASAPGAPWRAGVRTDAGIVDLLAVHEGGAVADWAPTTQAVMEQGLAGQATLAALVERAASVSGAVLDPTSVTLGPVIPAPQKIVAIGLNYRKHAAESGMPIPEYPIAFNKFPNALAGPGETVVIPRVTQKADYEVELAVIIGKRAASVSVDAALDHVWGYATSNDLSARDLQFRTAQWMLGKTLDGFLPIGPDLVTSDEVPDPQALRLRTWLNGELRQDSTTADMIFSVAELVSYCSHYFTLVPGDIMITGTPAGVIGGMKDPVWLKGGDVVVVEVEGLGRLETPLVDEA
jgi:2-keto-4-pentenoate hydratase/2-oxohepta-3-ene-1,7-dioic acid hydratase in catechol pathway